MKVRVVEDFTGYPDGTDASRRLFRAGEEVEVPDAFGELVVAKGHVEKEPPPAGDGSMHHP